MENLQNKINKLTKTSNYRFNFELVKEILNEFKKQYTEKIFEKAIEIDKKHHKVNIKYEKISGTVDSKINTSKNILKFTTENIIDGFRKYCCSDIMEILMLH